MPKKLAALIALPVLVLFCLPAPADNHEPASAFSKSTIDLGCVVSDLDASVKFYTEVNRLSEIGRISSGCRVRRPRRDSPMEKPLDITDPHSREKGPAATRLKLMHVDESKASKAANDYIHTTLGYSYITVFTSRARTRQCRD